MGALAAGRKSIFFAVLTAAVTWGCVTPGVQDNTARGAGLPVGGIDTNVKASPAVDAECTPGQRTCGSLAGLKTCGADSRWQMAACGTDQLCDDGACSDVICKPGAMGCDGLAITRCSARGTRWVAVDACAGKTTCAGGQCIEQTCTVGEAKCVGNALVACVETNEWHKIVCAMDEICVDATATTQAGCVAQICPAGKTVCEGDRVFSCGADGMTKTLADDCEKAGADGQARACLGGACVPKVCPALTKTCDGDAVATCKPDHSGWQKTPCAAGETCFNGACTTKHCAPSETFCDALTVMKCDASGTKKTLVKTCNGNLQECKQGGCVDLAIVCGDGFCDEGESFDNCAKDCKTKSVLAPDFDKIDPKSPLALPRTPRMLTKSAPHASYTSSTMAFGGKWLYVVDRDNGALVLMDRTKLGASHTLKVGGRPENVLVAKDGTVFITVRDDDAIVKLAANATSMTGAVKWQVGREPMGMAMAPGDKILLVALLGERAVIGIDVKTGTEVARQELHELPQSIAVGLDGKGVVTFGTGEVVIIDADDMAKGNALMPVMKKSKPKPTPMRPHNPVKVCRGKNHVKFRKPHRAMKAGMHPENGMMMIPHVLLNPGDAKDVLAAAGVKPKVKAPPKPKPIVIRVCRRSGYGSTCSNKTIIPPGPKPPPPCHSVPVRPIEICITGLHPKMKKPMPTKGHFPIMDMQTGRSFLSRFDQPSDIAHHPTLSLAFVTAMGTNNVMVVNTAAPDPMQWPLADIAVGTGPKSIVIAPNGLKAYVHNATAFTVSEIDLTPLTKLVDPLKPTAAMKPMKPLFMQHAKQVEFGKDPLPETAALGRVVFHNALNSRLSASNRFACATCHEDGREDKNVWFVSEGPRQTPALAGRLKDSAPFNWMGTKFTLDGNIMATTHRMGGTGLMPHEIKALTAFVRDGLVPPRNPNVPKSGLTPQQLEGKKIFNDPKVACATCHAGSATTDGAQHDVGTATPVELQVQKIFAGKGNKPEKVLFNTPTLRGLWYTAPYLHDGSAKTLKDALKQTAKTMGRTDHLTEKQLDALVAYLRTL